MTHVIGHFMWAHLFKKKKKIGHSQTQPHGFIGEQPSSLYTSSAAKSILYFCMTQMLKTVLPESEFCKLVPSWGVCWNFILVLFSRRAQFHLTRYVTSQNNRYHSAENPVLIQPFTKFSRSLVWIRCHSLLDTPMLYILMSYDQHKHGTCGNLWSISNINNTYF